MHDSDKKKKCSRKHFFDFFFAPPQRARSRDGNAENFPLMGIGKNLRRNGVPSFRKKNMPLLEVSNLRVDFFSRGQVQPAVKGVSFSLEAGEILAVAGESGSGKSVTSQALTGLLPEPPRCRVSGSVKLRGREILGLRERELRKIRGKEIAYVFQDPLSSLNPVYTAGWQIEEALRFHVPALKTPRERRERVREALEAVGVGAAFADAFPHQLSGGMQQRVMIAAALACRPSVLVADEPTTALDVTVQKQIMDLLLAVRERFGTSVLLITHNFGLVAQIADRAVVLLRGEKVEEGPAREVISRPRHPYTRALLACVPRLRERGGKSG